MESDANGRVKKLVKWVNGHEVVKNAVCGLSRKGFYVI